jgi:uncharacterized membrane protein
MGDRFKVSGTTKQHAWAVVNTAIWAVFILTGGLAALQLRGDIHLTNEAQAFLGSTLAAFVLLVLLTITYKANFKETK